MVISNQLKEAEIQAKFQHYGMLFGFVLVYVGNVESEVPLVEVRNGYPDWLLDVGYGISEMACAVTSFLHPSFDPVFRIVLTGRIPRT